MRKRAKQRAIEAVRATALACALAAAGGAHAGELPDKPEPLLGPSWMGTAPVQHGFGGFTPRNAETALSPDSEFAAAAQRREDATCRDTFSPALKRLVYIELRHAALARAAAGARLQRDDLRRFQAFLFQAQRRSKGAASFSAKGASGLLALSPRSVATRVSALKARQLTAQESPERALQECRTQVFASDAELSGMVEDFRAMASCRVDRDSTCFLRWSTRCPSLHFEISENFALEEWEPEAQALLKAPFDPKGPCAEALLIGLEPEPSGSPELWRTSARVP